MNLAYDAIKTEVLSTYYMQGVGSACRLQNNLPTRRLYHSSEACRLSNVHLFFMYYAVHPFPIHLPVHITFLQLLL